MNMRRKIFAGLCAFSMAVGAKGGSEKVAAAPIDTVRYGAQALLSAIQAGAFGYLIKNRVEAKLNYPGLRYWGDGLETFLPILGVHFAELNGLTNLVSSGYDLSKSEPKVQRSVSPENFDKSKSKPMPVDVKDEQKASSSVASRVRYGAQALASAIQTFITGWGIYSQFWNRFVKKTHGNGQPYTYFSGDKSKKFVEIASHIAFANGLINFVSSSYDLLKPEPEKRNIKSPNASPNSEKNKLEKDLKDKD